MHYYTHIGSYDHAAYPYMVIWPLGLGIAHEQEKENSQKWAGQPVCEPLLGKSPSPAHAALVPCPSPRSIPFLVSELAPGVGLISRVTCGPHTLLWFKV